MVIDVPHGERDHDRRSQRVVDLVPEVLGQGDVVIAAADAALDLIDVLAHGAGQLGGVVALGRLVRDPAASDQRRAQRRRRSASRPARHGSGHFLCTRHLASSAPWWHLPGGQRNGRARSPERERRRLSAGADDGAMYGIAAGAMSRIAPRAVAGLRAWQSRSAPRPPSSCRPRRGRRSRSGTARRRSRGSSRRRWRPSCRSACSRRA